MKCISSTDSIQYYYNSGGNIRAAETYVHWHPSFYRRFEFDYDLSGILSEERIYTYSSSSNTVLLTGQADYFYNAGGRISGINVNGGTYIDYIRYLWQGNNINKETDSVPGSPVVSTDFTYDVNHENTLVTQFPQFYLLLPGWMPDAFPLYLSRNTVIKTITTNPGNTPDESDYTGTYTTGGRLKSYRTCCSLSFRFYYSCDNP